MNIWNSINGDYFANKYNGQQKGGQQSRDLKSYGIPNVAIHIVLKSKTPQIYQHTVDAIKDGHGFFFRFDPSKKNSLFRRSQALKGFVNNDPTKSLDEYPYASVKEGGAGASVRAVDIGEQLRQGGQWRGTTALLGDGDYILIIPFDDISGKVPIVVPIFARRFVKELFKTATEFIESISSKGLPALQRLITTPIIIPCVPCMERDILPWNKNTIEN